MGILDPCDMGECYLDGGHSVSHVFEANGIWEYEIEKGFRANSEPKEEEVKANSIQKVPDK
uniref:Uncharacterized protein n=1 Tax=Aegilops tauschii TaxID=37682 RepID=M8D598_AEGTA